MLPKGTKSPARSLEGDGGELCREDEAERAHQRRLSAQRGRDDVHGGQAAADALARRSLYVVNDERPRAHYRPADDDRVRRQPLDQVRDADAQVVCSLLKGGPRFLLVLEGALDQLHEIYLAHAAPLQLRVARERGTL